ncbi:hypothetical protein ECANGB1_1363 [Enterospora canceri]|uniref:Uncharacterized protein n=1 Tax=Enterospora canceri TaxID=1081671 RepID=A0A1Y1S671_9MICR|nr:hypothetical protein ECANGB1_1363 [Enterospora canceri]
MCPKKELNRTNMTEAEIKKLIEIRNRNDVNEAYKETDGKKKLRGKLWNKVASEICPSLDSDAVRKRYNTLFREYKLQRHKALESGGAHQGGSITTCSLKTLRMKKRCTWRMYRN